MTHECCEVCGKPEKLSPVVYLLVVYSTALPRGAYHLDPAEDYQICDHDECDSCNRFIARALDSHPTTRRLGENWSHVAVLFTTPLHQPLLVEHKHKQFVGLA